MEISERNQKNKYKKYYQKLAEYSLDGDISLSILQSNLERDYEAKLHIRPSWVIRGVRLRIEAIKELRTEALIHGTEQ
ncbi:hypothetical protein VPHD518_0107 [Vibrio phage D518]